MEDVLSGEYIEGSKVRKWQVSRDSIITAGYSESVGQNSIPIWNAYIRIWQGKYKPNKIKFNDQDFIQWHKSPGKTHSHAQFTANKRSDGKLNEKGVSYNYKPTVNHKSLQDQSFQWKFNEGKTQSEKNFKYAIDSSLISHGTFEHVPGVWQDNISIIRDYGFSTNIFKAMREQEHISKPLLTNSNIFIDNKSQNDEIIAPKKYKKKFADKITNFNPTTNTLKIDTDSFGIDSSATFAAANNKRTLKKLANKDFDFLYDQKKGGLYFNENGSDKGFGNSGLIAILKGAPNLTASNLNFI